MRFGHVGQQHEIKTDKHPRLGKVGDGLSKLQGETDMPIRD
jgi:hypothetical protein